MTRRVCFVIPVYNHGRAIGRTVAGLRRYQLPIIVVDDGSDDETRARLDELAKDEPLVRLSRLPRNEGKGAAVMAGLRLAFNSGFTHALQIDADGQHDAADVPKFLALAESDPGAVVCGQPIYDTSVPRARLYGRYLTHVWVWIETLSLQIKDSMCGFRLYPLARTVAMIDRVHIARRMDFDIEILVRLAWSGAPIRNVPTRVTYPSDGLSHFRLLRDNLRISRTHARLFFGMLWRLPWLLWRRLKNGLLPTPPPPERGRVRGGGAALSSASAATRNLAPPSSFLPPFRGKEASRAREARSHTLWGKARGGGVAHELPESTPGTHWSRLAERGSYLGILTVFYTYRLLGRHIARLLLYPVCLYFFLAARQARHASLDYLRRVFAITGPTAQLPRAPTWRDGLRHVFAFAEASLDKLSAWLGRLDPAQVDFPGQPQFDALVASGRGAVLIGAHLGNWEMTRALGAFRGYRTINAVVYTDHAQRFNRLLKRLNDRFQLNLIQISSLGPETAILLQEKIDRGELLMIVGDRTPPSENARVTMAPFLGQDAAFAQGPFLLAGLLRCPVYLFFCLREGARYHVYFEPFCEHVELPRQRREAALREHVRRFAQRLEHYCLRAPLQWFNFFDFWRPVGAADFLKQERRSSHELDQIGTKHA